MESRHNFGTILMCIFSGFDVLKTVLWTLVDSGSTQCAMPRLICIILIASGVKHFLICLLKNFIASLKTAYSIHLIKLFVFFLFSFLLFRQSFSYKMHPQKNLNVRSKTVKHLEKKTRLLQGIAQGGFLFV